MFLPLKEDSLRFIYNMNLDTAVVWIRRQRQALNASLEREYVRDELFEIEQPAAEARDAGGPCVLVSVDERQVDLGTIRNMR